MSRRQARQLKTFLLLAIFSVPWAGVRTTSIIAQTTPAERPDAMLVQPVKTPAVSAEKVVSDEKQNEKAKEERVVDTEVNQGTTPNQTTSKPSASELASQINNPAAPVTFLQF